MANNQLQVALQGASEQLQRFKPKLAAALPSHIKPEKFERVIMTVLNQNPDLLNCDRMSLFTSCTKCAQDGLIPDGREAALVPFKGQVQYMPMVYGLIKRTRQSGELASLTAHVVYQNDHFKYALGDNEHIDHTPCMDGDRGGIIAAYAIAKLKDGTIQREVMTKAEIEEVRNVSRAKNAGPWTQWYGEMARKTVVRRLCKYLPLSAELMRTATRDDVFFPMGNGHADADIGEELRDITPGEPRPKPEDYQDGAMAEPNGGNGGTDGDGGDPDGETDGGKNGTPQEPATPSWALGPNDPTYDGIEALLAKAETPADCVDIEEANKNRLANVDKNTRADITAMIKARARELSK